MNGFLLAAGLGTRFRPQTDILAKPAIPLLNVPLAFYNMHLIQQLGLEKLVVNTHHKPQTVKEIFKKECVQPSRLIFSEEAPQILGTGGALKKAREHLEGSGTFVMCNADVVSVLPLKEALKFHHEHRPMATMLVMPHPEAGKKYGAVWVGRSKKVKAIGKTPPDATSKPYHFIGIHFLEESIFKYIPSSPCDINKDVYLRALQCGEEIMAFDAGGIWFDAGALDDYLTATESLMKLLPKLQHQPYFLSLYRRFWPRFDHRPNLWEGEGCEHLLELGANHMTLMGSQCRIHGTTEVQGFAVFGDGCVIEKNSFIKNSVIGSKVHVPAGSRIENNLVLGVDLNGQSTL